MENTKKSKWESEKDNLKRLILDESLSYEEIGRRYGCSGNNIKKVAKKLGISLPKRRAINSLETFNKGLSIKKDFSVTNASQSFVNQVSDEEFIKIINNSTGWKEIASAFGYKSALGSNVKERILNRCSFLNIKPNIKTTTSTLSRTKGELLNIRKNYQSYRSSIRKLAEKVYKDSGREFKCAICGYDKHIEIAHIKAVSDFPDDASIAEINNINNLIGLCPNHHWEFDNGILKLNT